MDNRHITIKYKTPTKDCAPKISIFIKNEIQQSIIQKQKQKAENSTGCFEALMKLFRK